MLDKFEYYQQKIRDTNNPKVIEIILRRINIIKSRISIEQKDILRIFGESRIFNLQNKITMKQLVKELPKPVIEPITVDGLTDDELVAYHCMSGGDRSNTYAVLSKLDSNKWGFINLGYSNSQPVYQAYTRQDAIKLASTSRQLYIFDNMVEMVRCIHNKVF